MPKNKKIGWPLVIAFMLVLLILLSAVINYQRSVKIVDAQTQTLKETHQLATKYQRATQNMNRIDTSDIRETQEFEKIGNTFIDEMFAVLPRLGQVAPKSNIATSNVVSAFLGATFGGDRDEGVPAFKLEHKDFVYSKSPDGSGLGFGTIKYKLDKQDLTLTLLMHIQNNKIIELQTGRVVDTTGKEK